MLWRATAVVAAATFAAMVFLAAPGSFEQVRDAPAVTGSAAGTLPAWAGPCLHNRDPSPGEPLLAFCARVEGRVIGSATNSRGETHMLVVGGFHATLVQLPTGTHALPWGSHVTAVGPLNSGDVLRELQAVRVARR